MKILKIVRYIGEPFWPAFCILLVPMAVAAYLVLVKYICMWPWMLCCHYGASKALFIMGYIWMAISFWAVCKFTYHFITYASEGTWRTGKS